MREYFNVKTSPSEPAVSHMCCQAMADVFAGVPEGFCRNCQVPTVLDDGCVYLRPNIRLLESGIHVVWTCTCGIEPFELKKGISDCERCPDRETTAGAAEEK